MLLVAGALFYRQVEGLSFFEEGMIESALPLIFPLAGMYLEYRDYRMYLICALGTE
jgi:hypothetical protein